MTAPAPAARPPAGPAPPPDSRIDLHPHEWAYATWRPLPDAPGLPQPFDPDRAGRALDLARPVDDGWTWDWSGLPFTGPLSAEEAAGWLWATHCSGADRLLPADARPRLLDPDALGHVREAGPFELAARSLLPTGLAMNCLVSLVQPAAIAERLAEPGPRRRPVYYLSHVDDLRRSRLVQGVRGFLMPRLAPAERAALAAATRAMLPTARSRYQSPDYVLDDALYQAAQLGLHDELQAVVDSWPDDRYRDRRLTSQGHLEQPQSIVFGLGSAEAVRAALTRLGLPLLHGWHVAAFLAHTATAALDEVAVQVARVGKKDQAKAEELLGVLTRVHDVAAVAPMLELADTSRAPAMAQDWLTAHPLETLIGAARLLRRRGRVRARALDLLRGRERAGADLGAALPFLDTADAARLSALVIEHDDRTAASTPAPAPAAKSSPPASIELPTELRSGIDLLPHEWAHATWRPLSDPPGPPPPFDLRRAKHAMRQVRKVRSGYGWRFTADPFSGPLSAEEAAAWIWATSPSSHQVPTPAQVLGRLADPDALRQVREGDPVELAAQTLLPGGLAMNCLVSLVEPSLIAARLADPSTRAGARRLIGGVRAFLLPRLDRAERDALTASVAAAVDAAAVPSRAEEPVDPAYFLAAQLGLHDQLQAFVDSWPDERYERFDFRMDPQAVVFGLGSADAVAAAFARLRLRLHEGRHVAAYLAHTGVAGLPFVAEQVAEAELAERVVGSECADHAERLLEKLVQVHDPAAVGPMLELVHARRSRGLVRTSQVPWTARRWLAEHPLETLVGAARLLSGTGPLLDRAVDLLRHRTRAGVDVGVALPFLDAPDAARLTELVIDHDDPRRALAPDELAPELAAALAEAAVDPRHALPGWIEVAELPPVAVGGRGELAEDAVRTVLGAAMEATPGKPVSLLTTVRAHTGSDEFAWGVVRSWLDDGAPSAGRWALLAAGQLGGDGTATRLAPLIRAWPGESQHQRAVLGLGVLAAIGTDTALMLLSGVAQKVRFKALQTRAREAMDEIAQARGMSKAELEDRIVPDGGLDGNGARVFDFGPRQFTFLLGPDLRPMVRDAAGKARTALPKPNAKDDPALAATASDEWKSLKKLVGDLVSVQSGRLELAMVTQRRWSVADFDRFLVRHPLQRHLVRLLVWGAWAPDGSLVGTFRVTDELDLADAADEPFTPDPKQSIGVVHPLQLSVDERAAWSELLADYEVVAPFAQLRRPVYDVEDGERAEVDLTRFAERTVGGAVLVRTLESLGWERGAAYDGGMFQLHTKPFPALGLTAVVEYDGVGMGWIAESEDQHLEICYVVGRTVRSAHELGWGRTLRRQDVDGLVPWGEVDPIVRSEVLADLHLLMAKAQETP